MWHAQLQLHYRRHGERTVAHHQHSGPLRILQSLYPQGPGICHNVLVHPPGGLVGGDTLTLQVHASALAHGLITTPGATRFYRSAGPWATQQTRLVLEPGARLQWLPLEAICYDACQARNSVHLELAPGAECLGWDCTVLGLPLANKPFTRGRLQQHLELPGVWLERALIDAQDHRLLDSPLGLAGLRCMATLFFASGSPWTREQRQALLDSARTCLQAHTLEPSAGATSPHPQLVLVRALAAQAEPAMHLLRRVRQSWLAQQWALEGEEPRIWAL